MDGSFSLGTLSLRGPGLLVMADEARPGSLFGLKLVTDRNEFSRRHDIFSWRGENVLNMNSRKVRYLKSVVSVSLEGETGFPKEAQLNYSMHV